MTKFSGLHTLSDLNELTDKNAHLLETNLSELFKRVNMPMPSTLPTHLNDVDRVHEIFEAPTPQNLDQWCRFSPHHTHKYEWCLLSPHYIHF